MTTKLESKRIGFLGGGAMARALAGGLVAQGFDREAILASEPDAARREALTASLGIRVTTANAELPGSSDIIVVAVKPAIVTPALSALAQDSSLDLVRPLWISIAAGVLLRTLEASLPAGARVVRAMPNTPALVGAGATAVVSNRAATGPDRAAARSLFEAVGYVWEAPSEGMLDAVTGLSGSGPAYVLIFLEALADAGVRMGLPRDAAHQLAVQTVLGTAKLALETARHPASLKDQVTSPGGTTIAGLERLEAGGLRAAVYAAVAAATERSRQLGG
jgi:pyrroline-5-carboxylate reductase